MPTGIAKNPEEKARKLSLAHKGRVSWNKGISPSKETREKLRKANIGKKYSEEYKRKMSERVSGKNHYNWQGGKTSEALRVRRSREYRIWRTAVYERDNYTCVWCLQRGGRLNADHIKPFALYPELRFAIDNGRTLCEPCHKTTETYGNKNRNEKGQFVNIKPGTQ